MSDPQIANIIMGIAAFVALSQTIVVAYTLFAIMKQNQQLQKIFMVTNYGTQLNMLKDLRLLRIKEPALAKVYKREIEGLSDEEIKYYFFNLTALSTMELIFYSRKQGLLEEDTWKFWEKAFTNIAREESFREMITRQTYKIIDPDFLKIMNTIVANAIQAEKQEETQSETETTD